jgi:hypothetical protein
LREDCQRNLGITRHQGVFLAALAVGVVLWSGEGDGAVVFVRGTHTITLRHAEPGMLDLLPAYAAYGYRQQPSGRPENRFLRVTVNCHGDMRTSEAVFPPPGAEYTKVHPRERVEEAAWPALRRLPPASSRAEETVEQVLEWIGEHIAELREPVAGEVADTNAAAVLAAGAGSCVGRSHLAAGLLKNRGLAVRQVHGALLDRGGGVWQVSFHRWIEVFEPNLGWVPSDPGRSIRFVDARHIVFWCGPTGQAPPEGPFPDLSAACLVEVQEDYRLLLEDLKGRGRVTSLICQRLPVRYTAALYGVVSGEELPSGSRVVLAGERRRWRAALDRGTYSFLGLAPGTYRLSLEIPGRPAVEAGVLRIRTREGRRHDFSARTTPDGSLHISAVIGPTPGERAQRGCGCPDPVP